MYFVDIVWDKDDDLLCPIKSLDEDLHVMYFDDIVGD